MNHASTGERELVRACVQGSPGAWSELVRRFIRLVYHVVRETLLSRTGKASREDVDDLAEDVFAHLVADRFRALATLREPYHLKSWLAVVARRKALDACKKKEIRVVSLDQPVIKDGTSAPLGRFLCVEETSSVDAEEIRMILEKTPLSGKERLLITLSYFHENTYHEMAEATGMTRNSIGPTIRRALDKVKKEFQLRARAEKE